MKRRELLSGLFALSAAGLVTGCHGSEMPQPENQQSKAPATLKVILQGPFAVVLKKRDERFTISAFIPPDPAHEFRFGTPMNVEKSGPKYHFTLEPEGLEVSGRYPYIDHGFDDMFFELGKYPEPDYFVSVDLPAPDLITFIPPSEPVVFVGGKLAFAPLNHVLEYKIANRGRVMLRSDQLKEKNQRPLAFSEIFRQYQQHGEREQEYKDKPGHGPQFPRTKAELGRSTEPEVFTYFFGVGPAPKSLTTMDAIQHGLNFFNKKLVPLFPNSPNLKPLSEIRDYGQPCTPIGKTSPSSMKPAVLTDNVQKPRLLQVTAVEDCRAAGLMGCSTC
jgi:hypothetical protein